MGLAPVAAVSQVGSFSVQNPRPSRPGPQYLNAEDFMANPRLPGRPRPLLLYRSVSAPDLLPT